MKTIRLMSMVLAMAGAGALSAAEAPKAAARVEVTFDHPENFTDVKDSAVPTDRGRDLILSHIREHLAELGGELLPPGDTLAVVFTDIDLAGDFEPWRGPRWEDTRIIRDIYPPAFTFTYTARDASGRVVKQGSESIRDVGFQFKGLGDMNDPLRYEKAILDDWMRTLARELK